jgi:hypothetical protein
MLIELSGVHLFSELKERLNQKENEKGYFLMLSKTIAASTGRGSGSQHQISFQF